MNIADRVIQLEESLNERKILIDYGFEVGDRFINTTNSKANPVEITQIDGDGWLTLVTVDPKTGKAMKNPSSLKGDIGVQDPAAFYRYVKDGAFEKLNESLNEKAYMQVAKTIEQQLKAGGPFNSAWSFYGMREPMGGIDEGKNLGYLMVRVKGSKLRSGGKVKIALNRNDLYDVTAYRIKGIDVKVVGEEKDVYADQLDNVLKGIVG
jgi:hypothetical protein